MTTNQPHLHLLEAPADGCARCDYVAGRIRDFAAAGLVRGAQRVRWPDGRISTVVNEERVLPPDPEISAELARRAARQIRPGVLVSTRLAAVR